MVNLFYKEVGKYLQNARISRHLTQQDVADRLKVSRSTVTSWELGRRIINMDDVCRYCDIVNVDIMDLTNACKKYIYK